MKKLFLVSLGIAILAAFFASAHPDGLDFIAEKYGFAVWGVEHQAPLSGCSISFLPASGVTTALAGIAGVLITLGIFLIAANVLKRKSAIS